MEYLIKWKNYDFENNAWKNFKKLKNAIKLIKNYENKHATSSKISKFFRKSRKCFKKKTSIKSFDIYYRRKRR